MKTLFLAISFVLLASGAGAQTLQCPAGEIAVVDVLLDSTGEYSVSTPLRCVQQKPSTQPLFPADAWCAIPEWDDSVCFDGMGRAHKRYYWPADSNPNLSDPKVSGPDEPRFLLEVDESNRVPRYKCPPGQVAMLNLDFGDSPIDPAHLCLAARPVVPVVKPGIWVRTKSYVSHHKELLGLDAVVTGTYAADARSTTRCHCGIEENPILGKHPSGAAVWRYALGADIVEIAGLHAIRWVLPDDLSKKVVPIAPVLGFALGEVFNIKANLEAARK